MDSPGTSVRSKFMILPVLGILLGIYFLLPVELGWIVDIAVVVVVVAIMVLLTRNLMQTAADPIDRMNKTVTALTEGKMDVTLRADAAREAGEVGVLESSLAKFAISQHNFLGDLDALSKKANAGESLGVLDVKNYPGGIRDIANHINAVINNYEKMNAGFVQVLESFGRGEFSPTVAGGYPKLAEAVDKLSNQLKALKTDTQAMAQGAKDGKLSTRTTGAYNGEWSRMSADLNTMLESLARPVSDITSAIERMESGSFSSGVSGNFQGDFEKIKIALEKINAQFSGNLSELATVLNDISYGRTNVHMSRDYRGGFQQVQSAVQSVSRSYSRLAEDAKRAAAPAPRPTPTPAPRPGATLGTAAAKPGGLTGLNKPGTTPTRTPVTTPTPRPLTKATTPIASRLTTTTAAAPAPRQRPAVDVAPPLPINSGKVTIPSGAHEYNRKDYGKYK